MAASQSENSDEANRDVIKRGRADGSEDDADDLHQSDTVYVDNESSLEAKWNVMLRSAGSDGFVTASHILETRSWLKSEELWSKFEKSNNGVKLGGFE